MKGWRGRKGYGGEGRRMGRAERDGSERRRKGFSEV